MLWYRSASCVGRVRSEGRHDLVFRHTGQLAVADPKVRSPRKVGMASHWVQRESYTMPEELSGGVVARISIGIDVALWLGAGTPI